MSHLDPLSRPHWKLNEKLVGKWHRTGWVEAYKKGGWNYKNSEGKMKGTNPVMSVSMKNGRLFVSAYKRYCAETGPGVCYVYDPKTKERSYLIYSSKYDQMFQNVPNDVNSYEPIRFWRRM